MHVRCDLSSPSRSRSPHAPSLRLQSAVVGTVQLGSAYRVSTHRPSSPVHSHSVTVSNTWSGIGRFPQAACPESGFFRVDSTKYVLNGAPTTAVRSWRTGFGWVSAGPPYVTALVHNLNLELQRIYVQLEQKKTKDNARDKTVAHVHECINIDKVQGAMS